MNGLTNKYFVSKDGVTWEDVTTKFVGVKILTLGGMNEQGDAVNVYSEQWVNEQAEDFLVTTQDQLGNDVIIRKNVDLQLTFICGTRYGAIDTQRCHDAFVEYVTKQGDFYVKSMYTEKVAHVVCLKAYKPTLQKLQRGVNNSFIMGTIELHTLDIPQDAQPTYLGDLYIGFGGATINDPTTLTNVQHYNTDNPIGSYTIVCPSTSYLWVCFNGVIDGLEANGFEIPMVASGTIGDLRCYRTYNQIVAHTMKFNIISNN